MARRSGTEVGCVAAKMETLGPNFVRAPMVTRAQSRMIVLCHFSSIPHSCLLPSNFLFSSDKFEMGGMKEREGLT